jgi:hypothetical protein
LAKTEVLIRLLSSGKLSFKLVLERFDFLLPLKFLFSERFAGGESVFFDGDGEESAAFPAFVRALIVWLNQ